MWLAKLEISVKGSVLADEAKKADVVLTGYPLSYQEVKSNILMEATGKIIGDEKARETFIRNIKKKVKRFYSYKDFFILLIALPRKLLPLYRPEVIWIKPAVITGDLEFAEVASWDKRHLVNMIRCLGKECRIVSLKRREIRSVSITTTSPELTDKQKKAFRLAVEHGYYEFPKKIELKQLAKMMNVSYSTYQAHLKKAESRIMPLAMQGI